MTNTPGASSPSSQTVVVSIPFYRLLRRHMAEVELDLGSQVLSLKVGSSGADEPTPVPRITDLPAADFVSAAVLADKAKQVDDGLYAAVDLAIQQGAGWFPSKVGLLSGLLEHLLRTSGESAAAELLAAAAALGGWPSGAGEALGLRASRRVQTFLGDDLASKPLGFYTWSDELRRLFRQDRILQTKLGEEALSALESALRERPDLLDCYATHLDLVAKLTNPFVGRDVRSALAEGREPEDEIHIFPPSASHETELLKRLVPEGEPIPEGFDLGEALIRAIENRQVDVALCPESGWYDYQTWALEPIADPERMPEAPRLRLSESYKTLLRETFKGVLALVRETHVKQLECPMWGGAPTPVPEVFVTPQLSVEPVPQYYLRRAQSYRFVRRVLEESFGSGALDRLHGQTPDGPRAASLGEELDAVERLFLGAYGAATSELGLRDQRASDEATASFRAWAANLSGDDDVGGDRRMMVPLYFDTGRKKTKVRAFLGWASSPLSVDFVTPPDIVRSSSDIGSEVRIGFGDVTRTLVYPVTAEVYVDRLLDRDEFRRHCDRHVSRAGIIQNLF